MLPPVTTGYLGNSLIQIPICRYNCNTLIITWIYSVCVCVCVGGGGGGGGGGLINILIYHTCCELKYFSKYTLFIHNIYHISYIISQSFRHLPNAFIIWILLEIHFTDDSVLIHKCKIWLLRFVFVKIYLCQSIQTTLTTCYKIPRGIYAIH